MKHPNRLNPYNAIRRLDRYLHWWAREEHGWGRRRNRRDRSWIMNCGVWVPPQFITKDVYL